MVDVTLELLDESRASYAEPVTFGGRIVVAEQPKPWEAPVEDMAGVPSHVLHAPDRADIRPLRYVKDPAGTVYLIQRKRAVSARFATTQRWDLLLAPRFL